MKNQVNTVILSFSNALSTHQITQFRGAIIAAIGEKANTLFHNHQDDKFRYSYPLVQYKRIRQKAAIVCIKDGAEAIGQFFANADLCVKIGEDEVQLQIESVTPNRTLVQLWDDKFNYRIRKWLPLNAKNYEEFIKLEGLSEKVSFLEKILIGNLLSFAKGVDVKIENQLLCNITSLSEPTLIRNKGVKLMAFDIEFKTNLSIPEFIGIGKNASIGYGILTEVRGGRKKKLEY